MILLPKRQQAVLDFIRQFIVERGYPPTQREICEHMGFSSNKTASDHLRALERKGYLIIEAYTSRGIKLIEPTPDRLTAALLALAERSRETIAAWDTWNMGTESAGPWSQLEAAIDLERLALVEVDAAKVGSK